MSISNDQPISAGNLKAALDGLTGGGSLIKSKVLYRSTAQTQVNIVSLADTVANYDAVIVCFEDTPAFTDDKSTFAQSTFYYSYKRQSFSIRLANEYDGKTFIKFNNKTAKTWGGDYLRLILGINF